MRPVDVLQWILIAALVAVLLWSQPAPAERSWSGTIFSWPSWGSGLVMGWTQNGFPTERDCRMWLVEQRVRAGRGPATVTHTITGECKQ